MFTPRISHYDHLDFPSIKKLRGNPDFYVPAGLKKLFNKKGRKTVHEMNWWDRFETRVR
jgi:L-ascorbate metabolism protein UlaG (beta-lactamase superfamily)